jgi:hypothetical protein
LDTQEEPLIGGRPADLDPTAVRRPHEAIERTESDEQSLWAGLESNWIDKEQIAPAEQGKLATTRRERRGGNCGDGSGIDRHATRVEQMEPPRRDEQQLSSMR